MPNASFVAFVIDASAMKAMQRIWFAVPETVVEASADGVPGTHTCVVDVAVEPVGPVVPVEPVAPVAPVAPVGPIRPPALTVLPLATEVPEEAFPE